jgi:chloramphenicol 3-O phosphotransferase
MTCSEAMLQLWETEVHSPGIYDLEVNTAELTPAEIVEKILNRLLSPPRAFRRISEVAP